MLSSSSLRQELVRDRRGFALCSPSVRIAIAQPCPAFSSSSPLLPGPFPAARSQALLLLEPRGGGEGAQAPGVRSASRPRRDCTLATSKAVEAEGPLAAASPSFGPGVDWPPKREPGPGKGWRCVCFFQSADSLGCALKAAVCSRDPRPLPLVSRPR